MATGRPDIVALDGLFSEDELTRIERECARLPLEDRIVGPEGEISHNRFEAKVGALPHGSDTGWLFLKLMDILNSANTRLRVDLWGIAEPAQYVVYAPGRYCWHVDSAMPVDDVPRVPRKLSFELLLSPQNEYEGGDREFLGSTRSVAGKDRGRLVIWPSFLLTRVDHVTSGSRRSLDGWVSGLELR